MSFLRPLPLFILAFFPLAEASAGSFIRPGDRVAILGNTYADQLRIHGYLETLAPSALRGQAGLGPQPGVGR